MNGMSSGNPAVPAGRTVRLATIWLAGCSGCHMSFLDLDEQLIDLAGRVQLVYSPIADLKAFPAHVDVTLVEGAVATHEERDFIRMVRERTRLLISFGDCAVTGNVTALRNPLGGARQVLEASYGESAAAPGGATRGEDLPVLLDRVVPVHQIVRVDAHLPGCPPDPTLIHDALTALLDGRLPDLSGRLRYG
jgi:NAD-reducing hydrogenase small subunit